MIKKKILILGYSSFFKRRVSKSLNKIKNLEVFICSKSNKINHKQRIFYNDYEEALKDKPYDFVYISLINSMHYLYAKKALELKLNVIIDKPITTSFNDTKRLLQIAKKNKLLLWEMIIFNHHKIFNKIIKIFHGIKNIDYIYSSFNAPFTESTKKLITIKKNVNHDMGPYLAAMDRIFFNKSLNKKIILKKGFQKNLMTKLNINISSKNLQYYGQFCIRKAYESKIIFGSKKIMVEIPVQAFALSANKLIKIKILKKNKISYLSLKDDYIKRSFLDLFRKKQEYSYYYDLINRDNLFMKKNKLFS